MIRVGICICFFPFFFHLNFIFKLLRLEDREIKRLISLKLEDLSQRNQVYKSIGWIVDHNDLMKIIFNRINNDSNIITYFGEANHIYDQSSDDYDLVFVADGHASSTINKLNFKAFRFKYKQGCLTAKVLIRGIKNNMAFEILRKEGPFAITGGKSNGEGDRFEEGNLL